MSKPLFPQFPDDPGSLSRDQLAELLEQSDASIDTLDKAESLSDEQISELTEAAPKIAKAREVLAELDAQDAAKKQNAADLLDQLRRPAPVAETPVEPVQPAEPVAAEPPPEPAVAENPVIEPVAEGDPEPAKTEEPVPALAASAPVAPVVYFANQPTGGPMTITASGNGSWTITERPAPPPAGKDHQPVNPSDVPSRYSLTAAADLGPDFEAGQQMDMDQLVDAMLWTQRRVPVGKKGDNRNTYVARLTREYPEDRIVAPDDTGAVDRVLSPKALTAAGGLCAPVTPVYDIPNWSQAARPLRAALPSFNAVRGGIRFVAPPTLGSITTAVTKITAAADASGGSGATKNCQTVTCPEFIEVDVNILASCLRWSNLSVRAYPELMENAVALTAAAYARIAETAILDAVNTSSTAATAARVLDIVSDLPGSLAVAKQGIINRNRMDPEAQFRVLLPDWVEDAVSIGILRGQFDRFNIGDGRVASVFNAFNLNPVFYQDSRTGGGQLIGTQAGGALNKYPTTVEAFLFPEGSFIYVDSGSLDLGLVRDSTLNSTNEFTIFMEEFFNVAFRGIESVKVTLTTDDRGTVALPEAPTGPNF